MANVPNGIETLPKISIAWVGCTNVTDRRQTDGRTTTYSEHEHEFTFAKKCTKQSDANVETLQRHCSQSYKHINDVDIRQSDTHCWYHAQILQRVTVTYHMKYTNSCFIEWTGKLATSMSQVLKAWQVMCLAPQSTKWLPSSDITNIRMSKWDSTEQFKCVTTKYNNIHWHTATTQM